MATKTSSQEGKQALAGRLMLALRRSSGSSILRLPERYWPVSEAGSLATLAGVPAEIT